MSRSRDKIQNLLFHLLVRPPLCAFPEWNSEGVHAIRINAPNSLSTMLSAHKQTSRATPKSINLCVSHLTEIDQIKKSSMWPLEIQPFVFFFIYNTCSLTYSWDRAYARLNCVVSPGVFVDWIDCICCGVVAGAQNGETEPREGQKTAELSVTETACRPASQHPSVGIAPLPLALEEFTDWLLSRGFSFAKFNGVDCSSFEDWCGRIATIFLPDFSFILYIQCSEIGICFWHIRTE